MRVGVVIPVGGFAPYLPEALDAVLGEAPDAVVVVDDASDPPLRLHPAYAGRAEVVRRDVRGGPAAARATGLAALGDVEAIALCDADDVWLPASLAPRVAALADASVGLVAAGAQVIGPDGRAAGDDVRPAPGIVEGEAFARTLMRENPVTTSSVVLRVAALEQAGGFVGPVDVAEDRELWLRLARAGWAVALLAEPAVRYRRHPGGLTADVARLARAQLVLHDVHGGLVGEDERRALLADDLAALAAGLARDGDAGGAREAWAGVGVLRGLTPRERATVGALMVPGLRGLVGRRDPYRR